MSTLDQPPGKFLTLENDDVWSQVRPLLFAERSSRRPDSQQPNQASGVELPLLGQVTEPPTLPRLQIDQSQRSQIADAATVLSKLSASQDFLRALVKGKPNLTQDDLQHQLDVDRVVATNPQSPLKYLTSRDAHDNLQYAQQHWSALPRDSVKLDHLSEFSSEHLKQEHVILDSHGNVSAKQGDNAVRLLHDKAIGATESTKASPVVQDNLDTQRFVGAAQDLLRRIDKQGDGRVTKEDLQRAMKDPTISGTQAQALAILYGSFELLTKLSGDKKNGEPCVSLATLQRFDQIRRNDINNQSYLDWSDQAFDKYGGKEGEISRENLEKALRSNPGEPDKTYLQYTLKHFNDFHSPDSGEDPNTVSFGELVEYFNRDQNGTSALSVVRLLVGQTKIDPDSSGKLYGKETPEASINPAGVNQSDLLTDCYMMGPLADMAARNPEALRKMIKQNSDGSYTVTFPGAPNDPITVPAPTEAELRLFNHGGSYGIWANVFEKAFGQMQTDSSLIRRIGEALGTYKRTPEEVLTELGDPRTGIKLLTGSESDQIALPNQSVPQIKAEIEKALREHKLFVLGSSVHSTGELYPAHAYTVVAIKPDGHGGEVVVMREPSKGGATVEIPLSQVQHSFSYMFIQR